MLLISPREDGQTLAAVLKHRLGLTWTQARRLVAKRQVRIDDQVCPDPVRRLKRGQRIDVQTEERSAPKRPRAKPTPKPLNPIAEKPKRERPAPTLVHLDDHLVVVEKPPGLTTMRHASEATEFGARAKRFLPPTLADLLPRLIGDATPVRAVHRLDRDTSGLVVFARTEAAEAHLGKQFRAHTVGRRYLALVRGRAKAERIESVLIADRGDGRRGSSPASGEGQRAVTHVRSIEDLGDFSLVECRLETGRTHQVRIHLGERGTPLCGEQIYDRPIHGAPLPDASGAPRVALHAAHLGLRHPATEKWIEWESPLPTDMVELLGRLRKR